MMRMPAPAKTASKAVVNLLSRSRIKNRSCSARVAEVHQQVAGLLGHPAAGGMGGDPGDVHPPGPMLDHPEDVEAAQEDGVDMGEVAREDRVACAARNWRQVGPVRRGAGSRPAPLRIVHTVEAATGWPRPTSSPWIRR